MPITVLAAPPAPAPCVDAKACSEPLGLPGSSRWVRIYRTYSLTAQNAAVTRAFILVHGFQRDADSHFRTAVAGGLLAGRLGDTVIVAPRFASRSDASSHPASECRDSLGAGEVNWICEGQRSDTWRSGGPAVDTPGLSSFDVLDALITTLADRKLFPNLTTIVVAGHSAGGQFVVRYALVSTAALRAGLTVSYIVANPSSYAYLDGWRPMARAPSTPANAATEFAPFPDAAKCPTYNDWPYGLARRVGYSGRLEPDALIRQFVRRPITYLLGDADVLPTGVFDASCPARAQGDSRLTRGTAFAEYMRSRFDARQQAVLVPACGHNVRCMFTADVSLPLMFPK